MMRFLLALLSVTLTHAAGPCRVSFDAQVVDWNRRCIASTADAVNNTFSLEVSSLWMRDVRNAGLYPGKILRANLFCGRYVSDGTSNLRSVGCPLIADAGTATDVPSAAASGWVYSETGSSGGLNNNNNGYYLNTGFAATTALSSDNDAHLAVYVITGNTEGTWCMGALPLAGTGWGIPGPSYTALGTRLDCWNGNLAVPIADSNGKGFYLGTRGADASADLYKNGTLLVASPSEAGTRPSQTMFVFALNFNGSVNAPSTKTLAGYSLGLAIPTNSIVAYYNAWQAFETRLGRQQ